MGTTRQATTTQDTGVTLAAHLEPEGLAALRQRLANCRAYLEYGCGGSTLEAAAAKVPWIFSVDTDREWLDRVAAHLKGRNVRADLVHAQLGPVTKWGYPATTEKFADFHLYPSAPWDAAERAGVAPDVVFIDGRFRVASFLASLVRLAPGGTILFDDYAGRPHYHVVEAFCRPASLAGRMAVFEPAGIACTLELMKRYAQYCSVPD